MFLPIRAVAAIATAFSVMVGSWGYTMPHQNPTDTLILVNKQNKAPNLKPVLVKPDVTPTSEGVSENIYMRPVAAKALEELFAAAEEEGVILYATSGYRSYSTQKAIYDRRVKERGKSRTELTTAPPGCSEHQTGLAMDVEGESTKGSGLTKTFGDSPEGKWLAENCYRFGYIIRYGEDWRKITGYAYEPWHIRYVGVEHSMAIKELDVPFETYLQLLRSERLSELDALIPEETEEETP